MTEIVLMICLLASPTTCEERVIDGGGGALADPIHCMMGAPPYLAAWGRTHEEWVIKRWRCRYVGSELEAELPGRASAPQQ